MERTHIAAVHVAHAGPMDPAAAGDHWLDHWGLPLERHPFSRGNAYRSIVGGRVVWCGRAGLCGRAGVAAIWVVIKGWWWHARLPRIVDRCIGSGR